MQFRVIAKVLHNLYYVCQWIVKKCLSRVYTLQYVSLTLNQMSFIIMYMYVSQKKRTSLFTSLTYWKNELCMHVHFVWHHVVSRDALVDTNTDIIHISLNTFYSCDNQDAEIPLCVDSNFVSDVSRNENSWHILLVCKQKKKKKFAVLFVFWCNKFCNCYCCTKLDILCVEDLCFAAIFAICVCPAVTVSMLSMVVEYICISERTRFTYWLPVCELSA